VADIISENLTARDWMNVILFNLSKSFVGLCCC